MTTIIKSKNSITTTNVPTGLAQGELAINITDRKVWVGDNAGNSILSPPEFSTATQYDNIAIGNAALCSMTNSSNNIAVGYQSGMTNQGAFSLAVGYLSGAYNQGSSSLAVGWNSGSTNQSILLLKF